MVDVILISPPLHEEVTLKEECFAPLGLAYLAASLEASNFSVKIIDMPLTSMDYASLRKELKRERPLIIGLTCYTQNYSLALKIAEIAKGEYPESTIIIGGPHVTFADSECLSTSKAVDIVIRGEGEETICELTRCIKHNRPLNIVKGITYRQGYIIEKTPDRPFISDLNLLSFPARHLLNIDDYLAKTGTLTISTSRGCPYTCMFCSVSAMWNHSWRSRSPQNIISEINWSRNNYKVNHFTFIDDIFTFDMERVSQLCSLFINQNFDFAWNCTTRADRLNESLLKKMSDAGCMRIAMGVESGSQRVLDAVGKSISIENIKTITKTIKDLGIELKLNFIYGLPNEKEEDLRKTLSLIQELEPEEISVQELTFFPGTAIATALPNQELENTRFIVEDSIREIGIPKSLCVGYALGNHRSSSSKYKSLTS
ncbi:MAG: B12-binding domain-containing radical SAM protein [Candidatus Bathyarchaeota archaeon]|nr:B12-binding domain-containing radical SAM protein [Candidatus Bathyarchaeota archaeon]